MDNSDPAFPIPRYKLHDGMSLRDYFAAKAMQGFMANPNDSMVEENISEMAKTAYQIADQMLKARK